MNNMTETEDIVEIPEYKRIQGKHFDRFNEKFIEKTDWDYLEKDCFRYKGKRPYRLFKCREGKVDIENTSYSGIIQLKNVRIHFSTKVKTNLFYMLRFLKSEEEFLFDPEMSIEIKEGPNFFDIIGRLFLNELEAIIEKGILKKHVIKHENINFLKGKLSLKDQIKNDIKKKPKFSCIYGDLTFNNLENRVVLRALNLLIPMIRSNDKLTTDLIRHEFILKEFVELVNVAPSDCDRIHFNRLNEYYSAIIKFSKLILEEKFIRSVHRGASRGFNFIVNMNKVYEDFVTEMVEEVIHRDFKDFLILKQHQLNTLDKERKLKIKPDIVLKSKTSHGYYPLIIDAKYKREDKNADYYQVIAYGLAIPSAKKCCLIYPQQTEKDIEKELTVARDITKPGGREIKVYSKTLDLHIEEELEFGEFVEDVQLQIKNIVEDCLYGEMSLTGPVE